jgi:dTDP-4-dehydrorhamnose 3,5-epimerase
MQFVESFIQGLYTIELEPFNDNRGFFARTFCKEKFSSIGFCEELVQFNQSFNILKGTIRGMHYQKPPFTEHKLIRCIRGSVYDVAIDLRKNSPTYLKFFGVELSANNLKCILIPNGFAHGFQTLEDNTELIYHHTNYYAPNTEGGIKYDDPSIGIEWKLPVSSISQKDLTYPFINTNFQTSFL